MAGLAIDASWTQSPFVQRKIDPPFDGVEVFIIGRESGGFDYVAQHSSDEDIGSGRQQEPYERTGYLGSVWILQSWSSSVAAPFVTRTDTYLKAGLGSDDSAAIPKEAIQTAKSIAYEKVCLWLDTPHFYENEFYYSQPPVEFEWVLGFISLQDSLEPMMPLWLNLTLFAFVPLIAAWTVTTATIRPRPDAAAG